MSSLAQTLGLGFESHSKHGCMSASLLCSCFAVRVAALRLADHMSKKSYQLSIRP
jgi:hypothetical protein